VSRVFVTGLVLAAGASKRLGQPKQLLPYRGATLLDATLTMARRCGFDQLLVTLGGAGTAVRAQCDLSGLSLVENAEFGTGCGSSISTAVRAVDPRADGVVLLLGDQPQVSCDTVTQLIAEAASAPMGVCRYDDALGHPFWFNRTLFESLTTLHGDKAVWKLLHSGLHRVVEVPTAGTVPIDVDTWQDYRQLLEASR
jgi:molybdenum cofactor cytidylyltransferase